MPGLPDYALKLIHQIAKSNGYTEYTFDFEAGPKLNEHNGSVMRSISICGKRTINNETCTDPLDLVCKLLPNVANYQGFDIHKIFQREAYVYNTILPILASFQREKKLPANERFASYPKCYAAIADKEKNQFVIIMQDLRPKNFGIWPKQIIAPADHFYKILDQLGRLHGISFALKDQRPDIYNELRQTNDLLRHLFNQKSSLRPLLGYDKAIATLKNKKHIKIAEEIKKNASTLFDDCLRVDLCEAFGVISHSDSHNNNILYQYDEKVSRPLELC